MSALTDAVTALQDEVTQETTVEQSAVTLLQGIPALIQAALTQAGVDDATATTAVQAVTDAINTSSQSLAAAVAANAPTPPPTS